MEAFSRSRGSLPHGTIYRTPGVRMTWNYPSSPIADWKLFSPRRKFASNVKASGCKSTACQPHDLTGLGWTDRVAMQLKFKWAVQWFGWKGQGSSCSWYSVKTVTVGRQGGETVLCSSRDMQQTVGWTGWCSCWQHFRLDQVVQLLTTLQVGPGGAAVDNTSGCTRWCSCWQHYEFQDHLPSAGLYQRLKLDHWWVVICPWASEQRVICPWDSEQRNLPRIPENRVICLWVLNKE